MPKVLDLSDDSSDGESGNEKTYKSFKINESYASEYDKRKRRQELINSKQGDDGFTSDSSSDESEDENAELLTPKKELQILKVRYCTIFINRNVKNTWLA